MNTLPKTAFDWRLWLDKMNTRLLEIVKEYGPIEWCRVDSSDLVADPTRYVLTIRKGFKHTSILIPTEVLDKCTLNDMSVFITWYTLTLRASKVAEKTALAESYIRQLSDVFTSDELQELFSVRDKRKTDFTRKINKMIADKLDHQHINLFKVP